MNSNWGSRCAECGLVMESGRARHCKKGGYCNWHIPTAARESMTEMYEGLSRVGAYLSIHDHDYWESNEDAIKIRAAIDKADGRQS